MPNYGLGQNPNWNPYSYYNFNANQAMPQMVPQQIPQQQQQQSQVYLVTKVKGLEGANAFPMGPNQQVFLLDETGLVAYYKETDAMGRVSIAPYYYNSPIAMQPKIEQPVEIQNDVKSDRVSDLQKELEALKERTAVLERCITHGKSNSGQSERKPESKHTDDSAVS
jgi:hypothetical protein